MDTHILVIAADAGIGRLFEYVLRMDGYTTTMYRDWRSAYSACTGATPDLIIMDCEWRADTEQGLLALRAAPETVHVPLLVVCDDAPPATDRHGYAGIPFIQKPFDIVDFRRRVAAAVLPRERSAGAP